MLFDTNHGTLKETETDTENEGEHMAYEKLFNEIYSVVALKYFWPEYVPGFVKWESPDWLNRKMDFGMEVSQALLPYDGQSESFLEHYLGREASEIPENALEKYAGRLYFYNGRLWALLDDENGISYQEKILFRFGKKLEKLNTNYTICGCNALFLYAHAQPDETEVQHMMDAMAKAQAEKEQRFQKVFLDCSSSIYVLNFETGRIRAIHIPEKARQFMETETEVLRHQMGWEEGTIF